MRCAVAALVLLLAGCSSAEPTKNDPGDAGADRDAGDARDAGFEDPRDGGTEDPRDGGAEDPRDGGVEDPRDGGTSTTTPDRTTFDVWTFNVRNGVVEGMVDERTQIAIDAIDAAQPDVVCLNEVVDSATFGNVAENMATATGYEYVFVQAFEVGFTEGDAILSKHPIVESEHVVLPHRDLVVFDRIAVRARVQHPSGLVDMYCSHTTTSNDETQKADQQKSVVDFVRGRDGDSIAFYAGDLNATPDTLAMRFLRGEVTHDGTTGDFVDGWIAARPNEDGFTFPSDAPERRIDYVFLVPTARPHTVVGCDLVLDQAVNGLFSSDHVGVSCRFEIETP